MSVKSFRSIVGASPSTASTHDSTLIIIDAQNEYAIGLLKTVHIEETRKEISELLGRYRNSGGKVVHKTPEGAPVFTPGEEVGKEFGELEAREEEKVIAKNHPSAFAGTGLHEYLKEEGAKKVVLVGYMAHVCVSTTARQASELGYDVVLAEGAIGDRDIPGVKGEELVKVTLAELADAFGSVVKCADIK